MKFRISVCVIVFVLLFWQVMFANATDFLSYADSLAKTGIIAYQSNPVDYRLNDTITRAEAVKIAVRLKNINIARASGRMFDDVNNSLGDLADYIETAGNAGIISTSNVFFRPNDNVTRSEMLKMFLSAEGIVPIDTDEGFSDIADTGDLE